MIYFLSPRHGGPYNQLKLLASTFQASSISAKHVASFWDWLRLHFNTQDSILSGVPFLFILNRKKFFLNIRGDYRRERSWKNPLAFLYPYNIRKARQVIVPSHFLKNTLGLSNAIVIPNAIAKLKPFEPRMHTSPIIKLVTVTSFDFLPKAQGVQNLIDMLSKIASDKAFELRVFGDGTYLTHIKDFYEKNKANLAFPVIFHGYSRNIPNELSSFDIFLYWSTFDNMPNVLLEALAAGLPIIANQYGAFEEILGDTICLASSQQEFLRVTQEVIDNQDLRVSIGRRNHQRATRYLIDSLLPQWIKILHNQVS